MAGTFTAMRFVVLLIFALCCAPALADDWGSYENGRFGYTIDVPPGFTWGKQSDNGDGRRFRSGATRLAVWGGQIVEDSFEGAAQAAIGFAAGDGWAISYEAVTPSWASYSGTQGQRVLYERMIALCDGQYAAFRLEYSAVDIGELGPVVDRLVQSLKGGC
jgi:hypothetical protein